MIQLSGHRSATQICITILQRHQVFILNKKWKLTKPYKPTSSFLSGWVQNVVHVISSGNVLLMCDARPSYHTSDKPHKPWTTLSKFGYVFAGHCTCMAGYVFF